MNDKSLDEMEEDLEFVVQMAVEGSLFFAKFWDDLIRADDPSFPLEPPDPTEILTPLAYQDGDHWLLTSLGERLYSLGAQSRTERTRAQLEKETDHG